MSVEAQLITKIIETGDLNTPTQVQLDETVFEEEICRMVYGYIVDYYNDPVTAGMLPSREKIEVNYPTFEWEPTDRSVKDLCIEIRDRNISKHVQAAVSGVEEELAASPVRAIDNIISRLRAVEHRWGLSKYLTTDELSNQLIEKYRQLQERGSIGVPYPWPKINELSGGIREGEMHVLYGAAGSMKSWVLWKIAYHAFTTGRRVLLVSPELNYYDTMMRMLAVAGELDYRDLDQAKIPAEEVMQLLQLLEGQMTPLHTGAALSIMAADTTNIISVEAVKTASQQFHPDLICIDSVYLLNNSRFDWQEQGKLVDQIKRMAQDQEVPVILVTQASRNSDYIAFSSNYERLTDWALYIRKVLTYHRDDPTVKKPVLFIRSTKNRRFQFGGMVLEVIPGKRFEMIQYFQSEKELDAAYGEAEAAAAAERLTPASVRQLVDFQEGWDAEAD